VWERLEGVLERFEDAWRSGGRPALEDYLTGSGAERQALLVELAHADLHYRLKAGEAARVEVYLAQHVELSDDPQVALELIVAEYRQRREREPGLTASDYQRRFPEYAGELAGRLGDAPLAPGTAAGPARPGAAAAPDGDSAVEQGGLSGGTIPAAAVVDPEAALPAVAGYEVLGELGRGGMGVVYKARHVALNRVVALKMILSGGYASQEERQRFRAEAEAVAQLQHPNIVQVYEVGEYQGHPYFSLEFCPGGSLASRLDGTPWQAREAARLMETLARATQAAHAKGLVHRDLKPANVLLAEDGTPKVTDFGLAKRLGEAGQTESGAVMGTPSYMAPEQAGGQSRQVGPAADVYALGAVLYELLTGRPPFRGATSLDTLWLVLNTEPVPVRQLQPKVPRDLETVCLKCLEKNVARRYGSAAALAEDLRRFGAGEPVAARPTGRLRRAAKWAQRRPAVAALLMLLIAAAAAALVSAVMAVGARDDALRLANQEKQEREKAEWQLYANQVARAERELQDNDISQALTLLDASQPNLRGWEYRYLLNQCRQRVRLFGEPSHQIHSACFSPDGKRLASAGRDGIVRVWDVAAGAEALALRGHSYRVSSVCFSPDGRRLASATDLGAVRVWDTATGAEALALKGLSRPFSSVCFSPDGKLLASAYLAEKVQVWDAATGTETLAFWHTGLTFVCYSPDGRYLAIDGYRRVSVRDAATGTQTLVLETGPVRSVCFSPDSKFLASLADDGTVRVWEVATRAERLALKGHSGFNKSVCFSPDGKLLASGGDRTVRVWDVATGAEKLTLRGHAPFVASSTTFRGVGYVTSVCFSPDGRRLASAYDDGTVRVWESATGAEALALKGHSGPISSVCFSPDGRRLAAACEDGTVRVWDAGPNE
jgi:WD40 repeat protein